MTKPHGFDNEKYLSEQYEKILERVQSFDNKLYLDAQSDFTGQGFRF